MTDLWGDEPIAVQLPPKGTGARARLRQRRRRQRRTQEAWFASAVVLLAAAIPLLAYVGFRNIVTSREGRQVSAENDPGKPNFEVNVVPTPVLLLAHTTDEGLAGLTMMSLGANDAGGGVVFIPTATLTDDVVLSASEAATSTTSDSSASSAKSASSIDQITLRAAFDDKGFDPTVQLTANVAGLSFNEAVSLDDTSLAQYVAPVAPLTINNPDRLVTVDSKGKTTVAFAAGEIDLDANAVAQYLRLRNPDESDLARLARQQIVWKAWLAAIKSSTDPNVVPGETASGLGRYLRGLARGDVQFATLPASPDTDSEGNEVFVHEAVQTEALMTTFVPFPTPANPGDRVRVRLLSGVGPVDVVALLATRLVPFDAQVTIVGNADGFDYTESQIVYYDDAYLAAATELQKLLGVGRLTKATTATDSEDITFIIGQDLVDKQGLDITQDN